MAGASVTQNSGTRRGFSNADNHSRHEWRNFGGVLQMSIYDEMRALASLDLTRNEMKVWLIYRAEMDEAARQVRGKTAECLRSKTDLGRAQFAAASAGLQAKGIIETRRQRNAAQVIFVPELKPESPESPDIQETHNSEKPGCPGNPAAGSPGFPAVGSPGNPDHDILAAPVSTPKSTPGRACASADDLHRLAYQRGLAIKGGVTAKSARAKIRTKGELDGSAGIEFADGKLRVFNGSAAALTADFPGIDLASVCDRAGPDLARMHYPTRDDAMAVLRKWARIIFNEAASKKPSPPPGATPSFNRMTGRIVWKQVANA